MLGCSGDGMTGACGGSESTDSWATAFAAATAAAISGSDSVENQCWVSASWSASSWVRASTSVDYSTIQVAEQPDVPDGVVRVYPSPATHQVTVVGIGIRQVELLNILGQAVLSASYEPADRVTLEMSALKAGVYFVRVTEAGGNRSIRKIIKE